MANENLNIRISQTGAKTVTRSMVGLAASMAAVGYASIRAAKQIVKSADEYTRLTNQTKVFAQSQQGAAYRMNETIRIARTMNTSLNQVGQVMQRLSIAQEAANIGDEVLVQMTENLTKAVALSGATAQEAEGALRQFAQGLAANRFSGQELNSVLEQTPLVAKILAKSLNKNVGELRAMGEAGLLTADVMVNAFGHVIEELEESFKKFEFPFEALFVSVKRESTLFVARLGEMTGATQKLKEALRTGIDYIQDFSKMLQEGGPAAEKAMFYIKGIAGALLGISAGGFIAMAGVMAAMLGPLGLITLALTGIVGLLWAWEDTEVDIMNRTTTLGDLMGTTWSNMGVLWSIMKQDFNDMVYAYRDFGRGMKVIWGGFIDFINEALVGIGTLIQWGKRAGDFLGGDFNAFSGMTNDYWDMKAELQKDGGIVGALFGTGESSAAEAAFGTILDQAEARFEKTKRTLVNPAGLAGGGVTAAPDGPPNPDAKKKLFTSEEATKAKTAIDKLRASFSPLYAAEMELKEGTEIVNEALRTQSTDTETQTMLMAKLGEQYRLAYAEANFDKLKDFDAAQAGAAQGFKDFTESIGSEAQIWAEGMTNAFDMATDALMTFATTGKFNIKQFARTMIAELQKVILKLLLVKALEAAAGAFGAGGSLSGIAGSAGPAISGALSGLAGGFSGRAAGGPVATGKPYMVGEKGPEMFVPPSGGSIKNNNSLDMKPQVNVSVVNVDDPSSVPNAMATQAGEEVVLNILQRNSDVLREMA